MNAGDKGIDQCCAFLSSQSFSQVGNQFLWSQGLKHFSGGCSDGLRRLGALLVFDQIAGVVVALKGDTVSDGGAGGAAVDASVNGDYVVFELGESLVGKTVNKK